MKINNSLISNIFLGLSKFQSTTTYDDTNPYTMFDVNKDGLFLTRKASNFVIKLKIDNDNFEHDKDLKTLLDTKRMTDFLKTMPKKKTDLEISRKDNNKILIKLNKASYKINESNLLEKFEKHIDLFEKKEHIASIGLNNFINNVEDVIKVVKENPGTITDLINFKIEDKIHLTTTDGYRIANCNMDCDIKETSNFSIKGKLIKQMLEAIDILEKDKENTRLEIYKSNNVVIFEIRNLSICLNSSDVKYRDFSSTLNEKEDATIVVNASEFTEKLKRMNSFVANDVKKVTLKYGKTCELISHEESVGHSATDDLTIVSFKGKEGKISFTADLLWLCLERYHGNVSIKVIERGRLLISSEDKTLIFLVLTFTN